MELRLFTSLLCSDLLRSAVVHSTPHIFRVDFLGWSFIRGLILSPHLPPAGPPSFPHPFARIFSSTRSQIPSTTSRSLHRPCVPKFAFHLSIWATVTPRPHPFTVDGTSSARQPTYMPSTFLNSSDALCHLYPLNCHVWPVVNTATTRPQ